MIQIKENINQAKTTVLNINRQIKMRIFGRFGGKITTKPSVRTCGQREE
jgi:hypothetical protein